MVVAFKIIKVKCLKRNIYMEYEFDLAKEIFWFCNL